MGKRIDELPVDDTPLGGDGDLRGTAWYRFVQEIEDLLPDAQWATASLEGIQETVERTRRVTEGQRQAVENIAQAAQTRRTEGVRRRRYEGWGR